MIVLSFGIQNSTQTCTNFRGACKSSPLPFKPPKSKSGYERLRTQPDFCQQTSCTSHIDSASGFFWKSPYAILLGTSTWHDPEAR